MNSLTKKSKTYLISELQRVSDKEFEITINENNTNFQTIGQGSGVHLILTTEVGENLDIYLHPINLNTDRIVKIPKQSLGKPNDKHWVALILFIEGQEPFIYLIPSKIVTTPDNHIFFDNHNKRFEYMSNWEIKVFTNAIEYLSQFSLENMVSKL